LIFRNFQILDQQFKKSNVSTLLLCVQIWCVSWPKLKCLWVTSHLAATLPKLYPEWRLVLQIIFNQQGFEFVFTLYQQITSKSYTKMGNAPYKSTPFGIDMDFCQLSAGAKNPAISALFPKFHSSLAYFLHPCPYSVRFTLIWRMILMVVLKILWFFQGTFLVKNFTIVKHEIALFKTRGLQIRTDVSINNGKHQPIIILKLFEQVQ
jgi:hypothetical protein